MGNKQTVFSEDQLDNYVDTTFLTKTEILRVFLRFCEIQEIPHKKTTITYDELRTIIAKYPDLCKCPELKENPFRKRICKVFSSDDSGNLTFDQFVLLFSVFSERAPRDMKVHYAFRIYDFDGDGFIGSSDIENAAKLVTQNELTHEEIESIAEKVLLEGDIDGDERLSQNEFAHVITKSPDFVATFHFGI